MKKRERFLKRAKKTVAEALQSRDMLLGEVSSVIDALDKIINNIGERLEDWYSIYFPELIGLDKDKFAALVLVLERKDVDTKEIAKIVGQKKADEIKEKAAKSLGAELSEADVAEIRVLAEQMLSLNKLRERYEKYQETLAKEVCPNITEIAGADIAAKLISHVGSLNKLAMLPSSTIQVLGAEKALFKHLKNRKIAPPKHGIIFQHPYISSSPKKLRGKIARALANNIATAAKADAFTKRDISADLKKGFEKRYKEILEKRAKRK